jgi:hypothetical protein
MDHRCKTRPNRNHCGSNAVCSEPHPPTQNIPVVYVEVRIGVCAARAGKSVAFPAVKTGQNADSAAVSKSVPREGDDGRIYVWWVDGGGSEWSGLVL